MHDNGNPFAELFNASARDKEQSVRIERLRHLGTASAVRRYRR